MSTAACFLVLALSQPIAAETPSGSFATPKATLATFLRAIKANDAAAAKKCWVVSDGNKSGVLDVLVGDWLAARRFQQSLRSKFGSKGGELLEEYLSATELTDEAIDETLQGLNSADSADNGNTAKVRLRWREDAN